jgi:hypothetical protein
LPSALAEGFKSKKEEGFSRIFFVAKADKPIGSRTVS